MASYQGNATTSTNTLDSGDWFRAAPGEPKARWNFKTFSPLSIIAEHPTEREHVVEGLFREKETINIVASSKAGKSWLVMQLALGVASGTTWLDAYQCNQGDVLVIDNELFEDTIAHRLQVVSGQMGIDLADVDKRLKILAVRGSGVTFAYIEELVAAHVAKCGAVKLLVLDSSYRFMCDGQDENSNSDVKSNYNALDRVARKFGCAICLVHHVTKGNQSEKATADLGSGAGAQSRAADTHLGIIAHTEPNAFILKAIRRSGKAPADMVMRRDPDTMQWSPANDLSAADAYGGQAAKAKKCEESKFKEAEARERAGIAHLRRWWRANPGEYTERKLRVCGIPNAQERLPRLLFVMQGTGHVTTRVIETRGKEVNLYSYVDEPGHIDNVDNGGRFTVFDDFNAQSSGLVESVES